MRETQDSSSGFCRGFYRRTSSNRPTRVLNLRRSTSYILKFGRLWVTPQIRRKNESIYRSSRSPLGSRVSELRDNCATLTRPPAQNIGQSTTSRYKVTIEEWLGDSRKQGVLPADTRHDLVGSLAFAAIRNALGRGLLDRVYGNSTSQQALRGRLNQGSTERSAWKSTRGCTGLASISNL